MIGDRWICVKGWVAEAKIFATIVLVYRPHIPAEKRMLWEEISQLQINMGVPMIVMGDFNEIRCPEERRGCLTMFTSMSDFDEWINNMGLIDMPHWKKIYLETRYIMQQIGLYSCGPVMA